MKRAWQNTWKLKRDWRPATLGLVRAYLFAVIAVPLMISFVYTWVGAGQLAQYLDRPAAFAYWMFLLVPRWIAMDLGCRAMAPALRPWLPPSLVVMTLGAIVGTVLFRPISILYLEFVLEMPMVVTALPNEFVFEGGNLALPRTLGDLAQIVVQNLVSISLFVAATWLSGRWLGGPGYARVHASADLSATGSWLTPENDPNSQLVGHVQEVPGILRRSKFDDRAVLLAIRAEDHYVRVYTDRGDDLVLYRFSDAVEELSQHDGLQVHRSHWVAKPAIAQAERTGKAYTLHLTNGLDVPLSRSYIALAKAAGIVK